MSDFSADKIKINDDGSIYLYILIQNVFNCRTYKTFFLAHLAKSNVSFCHHLASVVR